MKKGKLVVSVGLATAMLSGTAFAAIPASDAGTVILNDQGLAYDIEYMDNNTDAALKVVEALKGQEVYVKLGEMIYNPMTGDIVDASELAQIEYTDANGNTATYEAGDGEKIGEKLQVESVSAITSTKLEVVFSAEVDAVTADNFSIAGGTVSAAAFGADNTTVELTVDGLALGTDYTLTATGLAVAGEAQEDLTKAFTMSEAGQLFDLELTYADEDGILKADGADSTLVTVKLVDANGSTITSQEDIVIAFTTTFGQFSEQRVAVQNGEATNMLTSEYLTSDKTANLRAVIVEASDDSLIGEEINSSIEISPNPNAGEDQDNIGASLTDAEANKADRIVLYFNKDVNVADYLADDTEAEVDPSKAAIVVEKDSTATGEGTVIDVAGIKAVPGNSRAMEVILADAQDNTLDGVAADLDFPLLDNSDVWVQFTDKTGTVDVTKSTTFVVTDSRKPEMLSVTNDGLNSLVVKFSEPVDITTAETATNWAIDGIELDNTYTISTGVFNPTTGSDLRNTVTIDLPSGEYFTTGDHSVQAANIKDWAGVSDSKNIMDTQTLDFNIAGDDAQPSATVEVQSPEQYVISFDKTISEGAAELVAAMKLQKYNTTTKQWEDSTDVNTYAENAVDDANLDIVVDQIGTTNDFLVETDLDWTVVYDTENSNENYYNDDYRLHIPADTVTNVANGLQNADINLPLNGAMDTPDTTSPTIVDIEEATTGYDVTLSEPVKLDTGANTELATESEAQGFAGTEDLANIPTPTAEFIKSDNSVTIPATVGNSFVDDYETVLNVTPDTALTAGEWILVVRSISDDVGNTAPSATKNFTVEGSAPVDTDFEVVWSFADVDADLVVEDNDGSDDDMSYDYVYVKYSQPISVTGDYKNATKTTNYTLDGQTLPTGTQIFANIQGYDNLDDVVDSVTIRLPQGTLDGENAPHVINVSSFIENTDAEKLANPGERTLEYDNYADWNVDMATDIAADLTTKGLVDDVQTARDAMDDGIGAGEIAQFESDFVAAQTSITALSDDSLVKAQYQAKIDELKAEVLAHDDFAGFMVPGNFDVTVAGAGQFDLTIDGAVAVTDFSVKMPGSTTEDRYTIAVSDDDNYGTDVSVAAGTGTVSLTNDKGNDDDATYDQTITVTDNFWGVSDTVTVTITDGNGGGNDTIVVNAD